MPLSASTLETALALRIGTELDTSLPIPAERGAPPADRASLANALAKAIAAEVVSHITSAAVVTGTCPPGTAGGPLTLGRVT